MPAALKNFFFVSTLAIFVLQSFGQTFTKQRTPKGDSLLAIYSWRESHGQHGASNDIILTKDGRFKFEAYYALGYEERSAGTYRIKRDTLILTSDYQKENIRVEISYIDSVTTDTSFTALSSPVDQNGKELIGAYYYINKDTSINGHFDPRISYNLNLLDTIKSLQVKFYSLRCSSAWVDIDRPYKFIKVTLLLDKYFDNQLYRTIEGMKFKIDKDKLIQVSEWTWSGPR